MVSEMTKGAWYEVAVDTIDEAGPLWVRCWRGSSSRVRARFDVQES